MQIVYLRFHPCSLYFISISFAFSRFQVQITKPAKKKDIVSLLFSAAVKSAVTTDLTFCGGPSIDCGRFIDEQDAFSNLVDKPLEP